MRKFPRKDTLLKIFLLALIYWAAAKLSLLLNAVGGIAAPIWPPTGIALAALLHYGRKHWPGIALGAFLANLSVPGVPWWAAAIIGLGNTAEAVLGAYLLERVGFHRSLDRLRDVLALVFFAALASTLVSTAVGVGSGYLAGVIPADSVAPAAWSWWLGDIYGNLVVAPFLLTWRAFEPEPRPLGKLVETLVLLVMLAAVCRAIFDRTFLLGFVYSRTYFVFPILILASLRFKQKGTSLVAVMVSAVATGYTMRGFGPFATGDLNSSLIFLQTFICVVSLTGLILSSVLCELGEAHARMALANEELKRLAQVRSDFMSMVTHELKTPLAAIKGAIEVVLVGVDGPVTEAQMETFSIAQNNIARLGALITNVLDFSKFEAGRMPMFFEKADLTAVAREACLLMGVMARKKGVVLAEWLPEGPLEAVCDADKISQVLINLIDNAVKFTGEGGRVEVSLAGTPEKILIGVQDTGPGISERDRQRIFDMFHQVAHGQTRKGEGVGLGLAVCKKIVEQHGGEIAIDSSPGRGARFSVTLPRDARASVPPRLP